MRSANSRDFDWPDGQQNGWSFYTNRGFEKSQSTVGWKPVLDNGRECNKISGFWYWRKTKKTFGALFNPQLPEIFQVVNRKENTIGCSEEWIVASCATMLYNLPWYYPETFDQK